MKSIENTELKELFQVRKFKATNFNLPYLLYLPEDFNENEKYPLLVFFHGYGECGTDAIRPLYYANDFFLNYFKEENLKKYKAIFIAPQATTEVTTVDLNKEYRVVDVDKEQASPSLSAVKELIDEVIIDYPVDTDRIYSTGLSMGGGATLEFSARYPGIFSAIAPVCPATVPLNKAGLFKNVNVWMFHGDIDNTIPIKTTYEMMDEFKKEQIPAKLTVYPGVKHSSWVKAYQEKDIFEFLFTSKKGKYNNFFK